MRNLLGLVALLIAAVMSVGTLAGYQVDQLLRTSEPVQSMAGDLTEQEAFVDALAQTAATEAQESLPAQIPDGVFSALESAITPALRSAFERDAVQDAWRQVLDTTRQDYTEQLETLFHAGTTGDVSELDIPVDLTPVSAAVTEPLREAVESVIGWVPGVNIEADELFVPEITIDVATVSDESADPYTWAFLAQVSQYWVTIGAIAAALAAAGLILGTGRGRWASLASAAAVAGVVGLLAATGPAQPDFGETGTLPPAVAVLVDHVQVRFTDWAQPPWWIFSAVAGFLTILGVLAAVVTPSRHRR